MKYCEEAMRKVSRAAFDCMMRVQVGSHAWQSSERQGRE